MYKIFKYELTAGIIDVKMPANSKLLHVAAQNNKACLWAQVPVSFGDVVRQFYVLMTGQSFVDVPGNNLEYIGTCLLDDGAYVLHVYELVPIGPY